MMQLPLSIPFTGNYGWSNGALNGRGYSGYFWTSTATGSGTYAYNLYFSYGGNVNPQYSSNKVSGFTVRCVAE